ncbi:MAG TPA: YceI family protein [Candidatus Tyrphobacter sp.]
MPRNRYTLAASIALLLTTLLPARAANVAVEHTVDVAGSRAQFSVTHVFVGHVTGTIPILHGTVTLARGSLIPIRAQATLDARAIATGDPDRDAAMRSPDWFDTARFPMWAFTSTKIVAHGATAFGMDGLLTMHGVTQSEHLDVTVGGDAENPTYHAAGTIDRHAFGMKVTILDPSIGNPVDVVLDIRLRPL